MQQPISWLGCQNTTTFPPFFQNDNGWRADYKVLFIVFKALHNLAPANINDLRILKSTSSHVFRSNDKKLLLVPRSHSAKYGDRNFCNIVLVSWKKLPQHMRNCDDLESFKWQLKIKLLKDTYD